ncbi:MAG: hypothetical protein IJ901_09885 [Bacteroidaceae bacterium]|nr:hypothetical protein [Bacteroidaceae bacterium]
MAQFSDCGGKVLPPEWENCAAGVALHCDCRQRTVPLEWENCAPAVGELSRCAYYVSIFLRASDFVLQRDATSA